MVAEEEKCDGSTAPAKRQRFYVELQYGETTIVSWKKLLKDAKKQDLSSSVALETLKSSLDINHDGGNSSKCNDSVISNKRDKHVRDKTLGHMQQGKRSVKMTKIEGEKNDGDSSIKLAGSKKMNAKTAAKPTNLSKHSGSPAPVKGQPSKELKASVVDVPILTYSKKPKTNKISSKERRMKVGDDLYDILHQNLEVGCFPVKINSASTFLLRDEVSSTSWHNDKSGRSRELLNAIPPCDKSLLKDSGLNVAGNVDLKHVQGPSQKRKITGSGDTSNPMPSVARKTAPKKETIQQLVSQCTSSDSATKGIKLTFKQKPLVPPNVKVRFLLKQEREALKSNDKVAKEVLNHPGTASVTY